MSAMNPGMAKWEVQKVEYFENKEKVLGETKNTFLNILSALFC